MANLIARAEVDVAAPPAEVWTALTDPQLIAEYFFGSKVETDWQPGHPISWSGEYECKPYEDHGSVVEVDPERRLTVTHFSPMTGLPDKPENYHTITYDLEDRGGSTRVSLRQDNNGDEAEAARATENWTMMLAGLKKTVETRSPA